MRRYDATGTRRPLPYYCQDPPGYYPYVPHCRMQWLRVEPQPSR